MTREETEIKFNYPGNLPVCERKDEIIKCIRENAVVVISGETGSGKTTQIPKMALEAIGLDSNLKVACTQPRRLAAVTLAERVAAEMNTPCGEIVGYKHRFEDKTSSSTRIKFITDGILLSQLKSDVSLSEYGVIMIDEAHERTLNIDFLAGVVKKLLKRRKDLKIIISSATLETEKFSKFFNNAPVIAVKGRSYPVEILHINEEFEDEDIQRGVTSALASIPSTNDTLVFLPGERDIRETADALLRHVEYRKDDVIPLLASLGKEEQKRAFLPSSKRKIILATNVAETSVTIPGIRAVIDSGLARIARFQPRTQTLRLQIEPISQASARQRAGRCGRVGPGTCIRLYSEKDFLKREEFTPPEILRTSLAGAMLTMLDLGLGDIALFPFLDPPKGSAIREAIRSLIEVDAIRHNTETGLMSLTPIGRKLVRLPLEPRLGKMLLVASKFGTMPSVLPIVAAMSCESPFLRPIDEREKADAAHAVWRDKTSDFLSSLNFWQWLDENFKTLSNSKIRALLKKNYISFQKARVLKDIVKQLEALCRKIGLDADSNNNGNEVIHKTILHGLLSRLGKLKPEEHSYVGSRGTTFSIHPSSALSRIKNGLPNWIMAGELVDTSKLYARNAAAIDPAWIIPAAGNLCKSTYTEPQWDGKSGFVRAVRQTTLFGLVIENGVKCNFSKINPPLAREIFIRSALIGCDFPNPPKIVQENERTIKKLITTAEQVRSTNAFREDDIFEHFNKIIPPWISSAHELKKWLFKVPLAVQKKFKIDEKDFLPENILYGGNSFPDSITIAGKKFALTYRHSPESEDDGITCHVKKSEADLLKLWRDDWLVPGMLQEKITFLLGSLPKNLRKTLFPLADTISFIMPLLGSPSRALSEALSAAIESRLGIHISKELFEGISLPAHLKIRFAVHDEKSGKEIAASRDFKKILSAMQTTMGEEQKAPAKITSWTFGEIASSINLGSSEMENICYPALHDDGDSVMLKYYRTKAAAEENHILGTTRLYALNWKTISKIRPTSSIPPDGALYLKSIGYEEKRIADDIKFASAKEAFLAKKTPPKTKEQFEESLRDNTRKAETILLEYTKLFQSIVTECGKCNTALSIGDIPEETKKSVETQMAWLVFPGFMATVPHEFLKRYQFYFKAIFKRLERAKTNLHGDRAKDARFAPFWEEYKNLAINSAAKIKNRNSFKAYRWMLEEFRISVFAPEIKTAFSVSEQRLAAKLEECF